MILGRCDGWMLERCDCWEDVRGCDGWMLGR